MLVGCERPSMNLFPKELSTAAITDYLIIWESSEEIRSGLQVTLLLQSLIYSLQCLLRTLWKTFSIMGYKELLRRRDSFASELI